MTLPSAALCALRRYQHSGPLTALRGLRFTFWMYVSCCMTRRLRYFAEGLVGCSNNNGMIVVRERDVIAALGTGKLFYRGGCWRTEVDC
jgi:hypothetical protein